VLAEREETMTADLKAILGERTNIRLVEGGEIAGLSRQWVSANKDSGRSLVIGGGDGSILAAIPAFIGTDIPLGILPLGTQNMVVRELSFSEQFRQAAKQLKTGVAGHMDVGELNGRHFLYAITLDPSSFRLFEAREGLRDGKLFDAMAATMEIMGSVLAGETMDLQLQTVKDGTLSPPETVSGTLIGIATRPLAPKPVAWTFNPREIFAKALARAEEGDGNLSLYAFRGNPANALSLLWQAQQGNWAQDSSVTVRSAPAFRIALPGKKEASVILDGEIARVSLPLDIRIISKGLAVFRPCP